MSNSDERDMEAFQDMLNRSEQTARQEKEGEEKKYKSHLDEIKNKFSETVKTPLEALSAPLLFENAKDIIKKGTQKVLGSSFDADTTKAVSNLVEKGDVKAAESLILEHKDTIDVNYADNCYGDTALMHASKVGYTECVELLLKQPNINVNHASNEGWTGLMYASLCDYTYTQYQCVELLLNHPNINVNHANNFGETA